MNVAFDLIDHEPPDVLVVQLATAQRRAGRGRGSGASSAGSAEQTCSTRSGSPHTSKRTPARRAGAATGRKCCRLRVRARRRRVPCKNPSNNKPALERRLTSNQANATPDSMIVVSNGPPDPTTKSYAGSTHVQAANALPHRVIVAAHRLST
jgi:hypothetical protein